MMRGAVVYTHPHVPNLSPKRISKRERSHKLRCFFFVASSVCVVDFFSSLHLFTCTAPNARNLATYSAVKKKHAGASKYIYREMCVCLNLRDGHISYTIWWDYLCVWMVFANASQTHLVMHVIILIFNSVGEFWWIDAMMNNGRAS